MLLFFTLIIAISGILYELIIATLSSYLIGDSVRQFSLTIGLFMSGMGIGAYLSRFLENDSIKNFFKIELLLSIIGSCSVIILKTSYVYLFINQISFFLIYIILTLIIGILVGAEIPMVVDIYKKLKIKKSSVVSDVFTFDYIGALIASLIFPIILLPYLGLYFTAIFVANLNLVVAFLYILYLKKFKINLSKFYPLLVITLLFFIFLGYISKNIEDFYLKFYFKEPILYSAQSEYQNIVLTKRGEDFRMYLNGNIQFLSLDEDRYHEALVDWPMNSIQDNEIKSILVLGGGDGLAVRNLLMYDNISEITLVELDPEVVKISREIPDMIRLNQNSLNNEKLKIIYDDAFAYIHETAKKYDMIIADFPDPRDVHIAKLYSEEFYAGIYSTLKENGIFVTQASNAFFTTESLFCIEKTINKIFGDSLAYHRYLPSFGDWGFVMTQKGGIADRDICERNNCTYFDEDYSVDIEKIDTNSLARPVIIDYYIKGYNKFNL